VQSPAEVIADPQLLANDGFVEVEGGALRSVNGPVTFSDMVSNPAIAVPELGEHTAEVLAELSAGAFRRGRRRSGKPGPA
jgi:crotonobetainyl-CoA:carnitine CoA-transferase CaiB-like acyl-CoA transferase